MILNKKSPLLLFLLALLEIAIVICGIPSFVKLNFSKSNFAILVLSLDVLIIGLIYYGASLKRGWWIFVSLLVDFFIQIPVLFVLSRTNHIQLFIKNFIREIENLWHFKFSIMPQLLLLSVVILLVLLTLFIGICFYQWYLIFPIIFTYILVLSIFDDHSHLIAALVILTLFAIELFLVINFDSLFQKKGSLISLSIGIILIFSSILGGILFKDTFVNWARIIDGPGVSVRNHLNTLGFYQAMDDPSKVVPSGKRSGLDIERHELGGPILDDQTLVYRVQENGPHNFRIITKQNYTGRGFNDGKINSTKVEDDNFILKPFQINPQKSTEKIKILFGGKRISAIQYIPQTYDQMSINIANQGLNNVQYDRSSTLLRYDLSNSKSKSLDMTINKYSLSNSMLRSSPSEQIPSDLKNTYTKLPAKLPDRVKRLAKKITKSSNNYLDKVLAIQDYLKNNKRFTYSKIDAKKTPKGRDFVDYFLFDNPVGYCDNFSTSMLVLLRAIGIPSRFAEGYTIGSLINSKNGLDTYDIKTSDAHSWPEVYFQNIGWVNFEPTPGFVEPSRDPLPTKKKNPVIANSSSSTMSSSTKSSIGSSSKKSSSKTISTKSSKKSIHHKKQNRNNSLQNILLSLWILIFVIILFIFRRSIEWMILGILIKLRNNDKLNYLIILNYFMHRIKKAPKESLTEYANRVGSVYPQIADIYLSVTKDYEQLIYHQFDRSLKPQLLLIVKELIFHPYSKLERNK